MAWWHSVLIKRNRPIKHGLWGGGFFLFSALVGFFFASIPLFLFCVISRKPVFDLSLNKFRGKELLHVSKSTASTIDDIHISLFGDKAWYQFVYLGISILLLFTYDY